MKKSLLFVFALLYALAQVYAKEEPVQVRSIAVESTVSGAVCSTEVLLEFYNPNSRVMEYALDFPLSDDTAVMGFALDIDGQMIDAVPVEKEKGLEVFEEEVRKGVDPALLEKQTGNSFKLRVYPIQGGGTRKVRLDLLENLKMKTENGFDYFVYDSCMGLPGVSAESFSQKNVVSGNRPEMRYGKVGFSGDVDFVYNRTADGYSLAREKKNAGYDDSRISVWVPVCDNSVSCWQEGGESYFMCQLKQVPKVAGPASISKVLVLFDASFSEKNNRCADFLGAFFARNKNVDVDFMAFRNIPEDKKRFSVKNGNWNSLRGEIASVVYDGCASYDFFSGISGDYDIALLFSDGFNGYGTEEAEFGCECRLFRVVSDFNRADGVASRETVIGLSSFDDCNAAVNYVMGYSDAEIIGAVNAAEVMKRRNGDRYLVCGRAASHLKPVELRFDNGEVVRIDLSSAQKMKEVVKIWAGMKIDELAKSRSLHESEIKRLSRKYNVICDGMSLIVLESAADYAKYDIAPPDVFKKEYDAILKRDNDNRTSHLSTLKKEWDDYVQWWNRDFPKGDKPKNETKYKDVDGIIVRSLDDEAVHHELAAAPMQREMFMDMMSGQSIGAVDGEMTVEEISAKDADSGANSAGTIKLQAWKPSAEYTERLAKASAEDMYPIYLDMRPDWESSPSFYTDVAYMMREKGLDEYADRVLSNLAENFAGSRQVMRHLARRLLDAGNPDMAEKFYLAVLETAPFEPQSYRDLGRVYERKGDYQKAMETYYEVIDRKGMRTFPGIELITLEEINGIISCHKGLDASFMDPYFVKELPLDVRVSLSWDTDNTDIDLHVIDPNGEETYYAHKLSYQGGRNSADNTAGYGPEDFCLKEAKKGVYRIETNYYANHSQSIGGGTYIYLDFYTDWGRENQQKKTIMMKLDKSKDRIYVGEFQLP